MEHDIYDSLRLTATTCEKIADVLNAIAECFEKVTACLMDLIEEIKRRPLKMILQKLRPDYKDKCKIRWLDIPNKVMQGRIRRTNQRYEKYRKRLGILCRGQQRGR